MSGVSATPAAAGRYEAPEPWHARIARIVLVVLWTAVLATLLLAGRFGWWGLPRAQWTETVWYSLPLLIWALFFAYEWQYVLPRRVVAVDWNERELVLYTVRGRPVAALWTNVAEVQVPTPLAGTYEFKGANVNWAHLFLSGQKRPYRVRMSWSADCLALFHVLKSKTTVLDIYPKSSRQAK